MSDSVRSAQRPLVTLKTHPSPHPFVRRGLVEKRPGMLEKPCIVSVAAPDGTPLGDAFWNPRSDIALRFLTKGEQNFDSDELERAVDRCAARREAVPGLLEGTQAFRLVHAEGDGMSGLVVDVYNDVLSVELFSAGWLPLLDELLAQLHVRAGTKHHRVNLDQGVARLEGVRPLAMRSDDCPRSLKIDEHGVRFQVDFKSGHKTGFFCDQRENRHGISGWTAGKRVLDLCTYTGGFAVTAAALGEAEDVTAVDLDEQALQIAKRNANINDAKVSLVHADAFDWCRQVGARGRRYDVVVLDPPKFIPNRASGGEGGSKYRDLNKLAMELVEPGGLLLSCSCSGPLAREDFVDLLRTAGRKAKREVSILGHSGAGPDHPVALECPESEYLKAIWMRVE